MNYYAVAELGKDGTWWISFPGRDGIISASDRAEDIVGQAQKALESAEWDGGPLPQAIEEGAQPPPNPPGTSADFDKTSMVIVVPYVRQLTRVEP